MDFPESLGRAIRELRVEKGISLRAFAELAGISIAQLSLIERDKSGPSAETLVRLAALLETDPATLAVTGRGGDARALVLLAGVSRDWRRTLARLIADIAYSALKPDELEGLLDRRLVEMEGA